MPEQGPGQRQDVEATKATSHGAPVVEMGLPGIAAKSEQAAPAYPTPENALAAQQIAIGERFVIMLSGKVAVSYDDLPEGADEGNPLWIRVADNGLTLSPAAGGANEVQTLTPTGTPNGGTFKLTFDGQQTTAIAWNATAAAVQAALEALSNIAPGDVTVSGSAGGPYTVTFGGEYWHEDVSVLVVDDALLTAASGTPHMVAATGTAGAGESIVKFGRIAEMDDITERAMVNLNARDTF